VVPKGTAAGRVLGLTIVYHPDVSRIGERVHLPALDAGERVSLSRLEPAFARYGKDGTQPLATLRISRQPIALVGESGGCRVDASQSRTSVTLDGSVVQTSVLLAAEQIERGVVMELADEVLLLLRRSRAPEIAPDLGMVGYSEAIQELRRRLPRLAALDAPVLIRGETGVGKELVAAAIHEQSARRARAFVAVNMGAIPSTLAASMLFGHVRGSFSGAREDHAGYFERADGGTLFLDEVGEAPEEVQAALLRVLDTGEIQRVGAERHAKVDVRLIAATDTDLEAAVAGGRFQAALMYRLAGQSIWVLPLRERRDDISAARAGCPTAMRRSGYPAPWSAAWSDTTGPATSVSCATSQPTWRPSQTEKHCRPTIPSWTACSGRLRLPATRRRRARTVLLAPSIRRIWSTRCEPSTTGSVPRRERWASHGRRSTASWTTIPTSGARAH